MGIEFPHDPLHLSSHYVDVFFPLKSSVHDDVQVLDMVTPWYDINVNPNWISWRQSSSLKHNSLVFPSIDIYLNASVINQIDMILQSRGYNSWVDHAGGDTWLLGVVYVY